MKNIAFWGSKNTGRFLLKSCPEDINVKFFLIDNGEENGGDQKEGKVPVISLSGLKERWDKKEIDAVYIYTYTRYSLSGIIKKLHDAGIRHIGVFRHRVGIGQRLDWNDVVFTDELGKPFLPYLQINLVDGCNLNCKGCAHFANLFDTTEITDISEFKKDLSYLSRRIHLFELRMMGGEPLLNKDLPDYINAAREILPETDLRLVTNGILLLKQPKELFECIKKNNVTLDISGYKPILPYQDKITALLKEYDIPYVMTLNIGKFYKTMNISGNSDEKKAYEVCAQSFCTHLRGGKLYVCPMEALFYRYIEYFNIQDFPLDTAKFGIDIYDDNLDFSSLFDRISESVPLCRYCSEGGDELFDWAVSDDPEKEDWIIS
ncbi:MAG: radical SAM protein [Lachnospiraceae bacterium]|nr:radical SAM protein [Lachnospiraceae bacterium]